MTLLRYSSKYVISSPTSVSFTSQVLADDTPAAQTFTLAEAKTALILYAASGSATPRYGFQTAINIDGSDVALSADSPKGDTYATRNVSFWVGALAAGEHTIQGRAALAFSTAPVTVDNRTLVIILFDGDEYSYVDSTTEVHTTSTNLVDDSAASVTFTPSGACQALLLYNAANRNGPLDPPGLVAALRVDGTDYAQAEKSPIGGSNPAAVFTAWATSLTASATTVKGAFATPGGTAFIQRRQLGVLLLTADTLLDVAANATAATVATTAFADDSNAAISRTTTDARTLLAVGMGSKRAGATGTNSGFAYGVAVDGTDRAYLRASPRSTTAAVSAGVTWAEDLAAGAHTVQGRMAANGAGTETISARSLVALWLSATAPATPSAAPNYMRPGGFRGRF
jgi:hypothetical protein